MTYSFSHRLKHRQYKARMSGRLQEIKRQIQEALELGSFDVELDLREPYSTNKQPRAMCFLVVKDGVRLYFGKKINLLRTPDFEENSGMKLLNGTSFIKKSLNIFDKLRSHNLTPAVRLIGSDILLFDYMKYPTFLSLATSAVNVEALLGLTITGLRALHKQDVAHLDPNWANMFLLRPDQNPQFIDFDRDSYNPASPISDYTIDHLKIYTELFSSKFLIPLCLSNADRLAHIFWTSLNDTEKNDFTKIDADQIRILEPRLEEKHELKIGLTALEKEMQRRF